MEGGIIVTEQDEGLKGRLCLDFTNTAEWHASMHPSETLQSYRI